MGAWAEPRDEEGAAVQKALRESRMASMDSDEELFGPSPTATRADAGSGSTKEPIVLDDSE